jgi:F0F1-type ATP synthase membrane subunit b/b'
VEMGWEATVIAISSGIIASFIVLTGFFALLFFRELAGAIKTVERVIKSIDDDARPALRSARDMVDDAHKVVTSFKDEASELAGTSRKVRKKITRAADAIEDRLLDLDALVDVAQVELEDTVLDVAAALRTGRKSATIVRAFKRAITGRRKR